MNTAPIRIGLLAFALFATVAFGEPPETPLAEEQQAGVIQPKLAEQDNPPPRSAPVLEPAVDPVQRVDAAADQPDAAMIELRTRMAPFLQAIRQAPTVGVATKAYARGSNIERRFPALHEAYMERLLQLGRPDVAYVPAEMLVRLDPQNGTAWGVLGYVHGKRKEFAEAMSYSVRAAKLNPDDPSILNNAGQMLAWYRNVLEMPDLPDRDKRAIAQREEQWSDSQAFGRAYQRIHQAFQEQRKLDDVFARKLAGAEAAVLALHRHAMDIDAEIADIESEIDQLRQLVTAYRYELYRPTVYGGVLLGDDDVLVSVPIYSGGGLYRRAQLWSLIQQTEQSISELQVRKNALYREGRKVLADMQAKRGTLEGVRSRNQAANERLLNYFRWDPPAVNGVVTDEVDHRRLAPAGAEADMPVDAETQAAGKVSLARMYLSSNRPQRAKTILDHVVRTWPTTNAAREARSLLDALP
jgi:hypothetical protein